MKKQTPSYPKKKKKEKTWNLLLVGDHGRVINFGKIKGAVISLSVISCVAILCCVLLLYLYMEKKDENTHLKDTRGSLHKMISDLKDEKDVLLAQLVIAQAKLDRYAPSKKSIEKKDGLKKTEPVNKKPLGTKDTPNAKQSRQEKTGKKTVVKKTVVKKPFQPEEKKAPVKLSVSITNFSALHNRDTKLLRARFKINNTTQGSVAVAGRSVVVFSKKDDAAKGRLTMPAVPLKSGRPDGRKGQAFKIRRFKMVAIKAYDKPDPLIYDQATVYVFDAKANLLFEETYPVVFKYKKPEPPPVPQTPVSVPEKKGIPAALDDAQPEKPKPSNNQPETGQLNKKAAGQGAEAQSEAKTIADTPTEIKEPEQMVRQPVNPAEKPPAPPLPDTAGEVVKP